MMRQSMMNWVVPLKLLSSFIYCEFIQPTANISTQFSIMNLNIKRKKKMCSQFNCYKANNQAYCSPSYWFISKHLAARCYEALILARTPQQ